MININKFVFFATIMVAVIFSTSCERNKELTNTNEKTNTLVESYSKSSPLENNPILRNLNKDLTYLYYSYDNMENVFYGKDLLKEIKWNVKENGVDIINSNAILDYSDISDIEVSENRDSSFSITIDNLTANIANFKERNGLISFESKTFDGRVMYLGFYNADVNLDKFINFLKINKNIKNPFFINQQKTGVIEAVVAGLVVLGAYIVYYEISDYCETKRQNEARLCTEQGKCYTLNRCSATCRECGSSN